MEDIGRVFESRNLDVLALSEVNLNGKGEIMFRSWVEGKKSG